MTAPAILGPTSDLDNDTAFGFILSKDVDDFSQVFIGFPHGDTAGTRTFMPTPLEIGKHLTHIYPAVFIENTVANFYDNGFFSGIFESNFNTHDGFWKHGIDQKTVPVGQAVEVAEIGNGDLLHKVGMFF